MPASLNLRDAHLHLAQHGEELSHINLADCPSLHAALERIAAPAHARPSASKSEADFDGTKPQASGPGPQAGPWLLAVGARVESWPERRYPTARELHDAAAGRPALIRSFDHHAVCLNARALALAGVTRDTPDPPGGLIERDAATGEPTGLLLERACELAWRALPRPGDDEYLEHVRAALADLASRGIVEVHDMLASPRLARALLEMERRGELAIRVRLYAPRDAFEELVRMAASELAGSRLVSLAGMKIFTDGTLNSRTAHMLHPFRDPIPGHERGTPLMSVADITDAIRYADALGYPVAAHAIGDAAVRATLDALDAAKPHADGQRIEHAQFIDEADIDRFPRTAGGVIASVQPCHLLTDIEAIERLAPQRADRAFPLRDLIHAARAAGRAPEDLVWFGSDAPIVPPDPADNLQAAVQRRRAGMDSSRAVAPRQAITEREVRACSSTLA